MSFFSNFASFLGDFATIFRSNPATSHQISHSSYHCTCMAHQSIMLFSLFPSLPPFFSYVYVCNRRTVLVQLNCTCICHNSAFHNLLWIHKCSLQYSSTSKRMNRRGLESGGDSIQSSAIIQSLF